MAEKIAIFDGFDSGKPIRFLPMPDTYNVKTHYTREMITDLGKCMGMDYTEPQIDWLRDYQKMLLADWVKTFDSTKNLLLLL